MPCASYLNRRPFRCRLSVRAVSVALLLLTGALSVYPHSARGRTEYQPIGIAAEEALVLGEPLDCRIELEGGPAQITVYSDPPGAVSYDGTVAQAVTIVEVTTSATTSLSSGPVTLYLVTDGATCVSADIQSSAEPEEPAQP